MSLDEFQIWLLGFLVQTVDHIPCFRRHVPLFEVCISHRCFNVGMTKDFFRKHPGNPLVPLA